MLWLLSDRKTRQGTVFASFTNSFFDVGPLLAEAVAHEGETQEDHEEDDDWDDIDYDPPPDPLLDIDRDPPSDLLDEVDDVSPPPPQLSSAPPAASSSAPPPPKRRRTTSITDFDGHKPQKSSHRCRAIKRKEKIVTEGRVPRAAVARVHIQSADPIPTQFDAATLPTAHGAYAGRVEDKKAEKYGSKKPRSLTELIARGFQLINDAHPLVDIHGRIFAVLVGQPRKQKYQESVRAADDTIANEGIAAGFPAYMRKHRRGLFAAINVGLTYSMGCTIPCWLNNKNYNQLAERLLANPHINWMANFASGVFALWVPRLYQHYHNNDQKLRIKHPDLRHPFVGSIFSCAAFNFGPNVWTFKHRDVLNLAFGWCAIQALGQFDATKGGHLILWDLKLVIEFPMGALVLIPSATLSHSNVPVQPGDTQASFTQFTSGGLFRYVDNGYRTEGEVAEADPEEYARLVEEKQSRWEMGLEMFSTIDEVVNN
ncbi:hypothetical protein B0H14DRAFT_3863084 [Mycena olivaceomarginata]|nr:hypothetical protein B0H14DRAFT_3863084 [Mycena olivaceomarginata]